MISFVINLRQELKIVSESESWAIFTDKYTNPNFSHLQQICLLHSLVFWTVVMKDQLIMKPKFLQTVMYDHAMGNIVTMKVTGFLTFSTTELYILFSLIMLMFHPEMFLLVSSNLTPRRKFCNSTTFTLRTESLLFVSQNGTYISWICLAKHLKILLIDLKCLWFVQTNHLLTWLFHWSLFKVSFSLE